MKNPMASLSLLAIVGYRFCISPFLGNRCRYAPTCSHYTSEALRRHGFFKGLALGFFRILRCHPWSKHPMIDPVPERFAWRDMIGYKRGADKPGKQ